MYCLALVCVSCVCMCVRLCHFMSFSSFLSFALITVMLLHLNVCMRVCHVNEWGIRMCIVNPSNESVLVSECECVITLSKCLNLGQCHGICVY